MFRRVLIKTAAVLAAGAVAVDRLAAAVAGGRVADRIASSESLADPPTVSFGGGPFLIQALRGRYTDVSVTARDLRRGPVLIARIEARLHGVRLRLVDALRGRLGAVAIDSAQATALLRYPDLAAALPNRAITLSEENGRIRLHGAAVVFGQRIAGSALGEIVLDGHRLTIVPRDFTLDAGGRTVALNSTLGGRADLRRTGQPAARAPAALRAAPAGGRAGAGLRGRSRAARRPRSRSGSEPVRRDRGKVRTMTQPWFPQS